MSLNKPNHNKKSLKNYRKDLRNNQTSAETRLWMLLKKKQLEGRKFRRQHSINNFIVDFYCPSEKLIIELDGQVHYNPVSEQEDFKRDSILKEYDIKVCGKFSARRFSCNGHCFELRVFIFFHVDLS